MLFGAKLVRAERTLDPTQATVFIRVIGTVEREIDSAWKETIEERNVEIGTGSGFVFTEYGHVLTNHHVVGGDVFRTRVRGIEVEVRIAVERIEIVFPSVGAGSLEEPRTFPATLEATDSDLDLAVLSTSASELPYLAFGDSDATEKGQGVSVFGFPFGRKVEIGKGDVDDIVPQVTVTRGAVSASRANDSGEPSFLQTSATVNPGNSGGPMVDGEGFVLGVIRLKLRGAEGVGFAVPVNTVKDFLEYRGYGQLLPTERLRLGPEQTLEGKGLTLQLPDTMEDVSPVRLRAFSDPTNGDVRFVAERVASPWELSRLEALLLGGGTFGPFQASGERRSSAFSSGRLIAGWASGTDGTDGNEAKLEYALLESGLEKVLVRYEGTSEAIAFNRSILQHSLASVNAQSLLTAEITESIVAASLNWAPRSPSSPGAHTAVVPERWLHESSAPFPCEGLPPLDSAFAVSPSGDFTVSLRIAWWRNGPDPAEARSRCRPEPGPNGETSYAYHVEWLGIGYSVEGLFATTRDSLVQLEVVAPVKKRDLVADVAREFWRRNR